MNQKPTVYFASFGIRHSSATRRIWSFRQGNVEVIANEDKCDRNTHTTVQRLLMFGYLRVLWFIATAKVSSIIWCWGPDICWLGSIVRFVRPSLKIVWDVSDLNPSFVTDRIYSKFLRSIDLRLSRLADHIVLTSPGFLKYFQEVAYDSNNISIIENKILPIKGNPKEVTLPTGTIIIVYAGILRSNKLLEIILGAAATLGSLAHFDLHGKFSRSINSEMLERIHKMKNIKLHGPYNEQNELAAIYAKGHVVFGMLDTLADENEGLLLPNRIYHAQAFGRPVVTTSGSVCADKVAIDNLGWAIESSVDSLCDFVLTLSKNGYSFYTEKMANLPAHTEAFLGKEYADLAKKL